MSGFRPGLGGGWELYAPRGSFAARNRAGGLESAYGASILSPPARRERAGFHTIAPAGDPADEASARETPVGRTHLARAGVDAQRRIDVPKPRTGRTAPCGRRRALADLRRRGRHACRTRGDRAGRAGRDRSCPRRGDRRARHRQAAVAAVRHADGRVIGRLAIINGVVARVPVRSLDGIRRSAGVRSVNADRAYGLSDAATEDSVAGVTLAEVRAAVGIGEARLGAGVDVALIDSGITPVPGLDDPAKVVNGPDLSADSDDESFRHLDAFGHGTHLAGLIAADGAGFTGVAPASRLINLKVADRDGATSLSRLLLAIDWVVRNRSRDDMNIRVLNLAFGAPTDGTYRDDPMAFAVEQAWRRGIVVVAAAGNGGNSSPALDSPAVDPVRDRRRRSGHARHRGLRRRRRRGLLQPRHRGAFSRRHRAGGGPDQPARAVRPPGRAVPAGARRRGRVPRQRHVAVGGRRLGRDRSAPRAASGADAGRDQGGAACVGSADRRRRCDAAGRRCHRRGRRRDGIRGGRVAEVREGAWRWSVAWPRRPRPRARGRAPRRQPLVRQPLGRQPLGRQPLGRQPLVRQPLVRQPLVRQPLVRQSLVASRWGAAE